MQNGLSIIIPIYNEEKAVNSTINAVYSYAKQLKIPFEIIAIDDGSTDKSVKKVPKIKNVKLIKHKKNKGYSTALKTGILASKYELVMITDADGTYPPKEIPKLFKEMKGYDMVVGARPQNKLPTKTKLAKFTLQKIANFLSGTKIPDINSGMRIFKKKMAMEFFHLYPKRFSFTMTITLSALLNDYDVKFVPIDYLNRTGESKIHPIKDTINFLGIILRIITYFNPLKMFTPIAIGIFLIGILIGAYGIIARGIILDTTIAIFIIGAIQVFFFGVLADLTIKSSKRRSL